MPEEKMSDTQPEDALGKEFDEIVASADQEQPTQSDDAVVVDVRRDSTPETPAIAPQEPVASPTVVEPAVPVVAPVVPVPVPPTPAERSTGGTMVLQWLSYAFWGWFGIAMAWLSGVTFAYFITGNSSDLTSALAYPLASVIVMFLLAVITDLFYARREPAHKAGGANAIMLIHVVLFVLIAVGAAVTALFSLISIALNTDPTSGTDGQTIAAWTSAVMILVFGFTAVRAMFGGRKSKLRIAHWATMSALAIGMIAFSMFGPVVGAQLTRDDRLIEEGLPVLNQTVSEYVNENGKLPTTLADANDASSSSSAASNALVARDMVRYTPNVKEATKIEDGYNATADRLTYQTTYYYRFCVTYKEAKKASGLYYDTASSSDSKYKSYLYITGHAKGEVCYNLQATDGYGLVYPADATTGSGSTSSTKE